MAYPINIECKRRAKYMIRMKKRAENQNFFQFVQEDFIKNITKGMAQMINSKAAPQ